MTEQEKAKKLLPIIQAIADGKQIEYQCGNTWFDVPLEDNDDLSEVCKDIIFNIYEYRIKPDNCEKLENDLESQSLENKDFVYDFNNQHTKSFRPFNDCNELIEYYQKKYKSAVGCDIYFPSLYKPCIWVKHKEYGTVNLITAFDNYDNSENRIGEPCVMIQDMWVTMKEMFEHYTFLDGSLVGKLEE